MSLFFSFSWARLQELILYPWADGGRFAMGFAMVYYPLAMAHDNGKSMKNPNLWVMFPANKNLHD